MSVFGRISQDWEVSQDEPHIETILQEAAFHKTLHIMSMWLLGGYKEERGQMEDFFVILGATW